MDFDCFHLDLDFGCIANEIKNGGEKLGSLYMN